MKGLRLLGGCGLAGLLCASACGEPAPMSPSRATTATTTSAPQVPTTPRLNIPGYTELWTLTINRSGDPGGSVTGKDDLAVGHEGTTLRLLYWVHNYATDDVEYAATLQPDGSFAAQSCLYKLTPSSSCTAPGGVQGSIVGQTSADGAHLDATETWTYFLFPAGTDQVVIRWTADRDQQ